LRRRPVHRRTGERKTDEVRRGEDRADDFGTLCGLTRLRDLTVGFLTCDHDFLVRQLRGGHRLTFSSRHAIGGFVQPPVELPLDGEDERRGGDHRSADIPRSAT
jgi:hypothetical protein